MIADFTVETAQSACRTEGGGDVDAIVTVTFLDSRSTKTARTRK